MHSMAGNLYGAHFRGRIFVEPFKVLAVVAIARNGNHALYTHKK